MSLKRPPQISDHLCLTFCMVAHDGPVGKRVTYLATYFTQFEQLLKKIAHVQLTLIIFTFRRFWVKSVNSMFQQLLLCAIYADIVKAE